MSYICKKLGRKEIIQPQSNEDNWIIRDIMNVNYFVKCRICCTVTRIRIPVGHLEKYPIIISCGTCGSILRGNFYIDQEAVTYKAEFCNCDEVNNQNVSFFAEVSGELICNKIENYSEKNSLDYVERLPFMVSTQNMQFDVMGDYIARMVKINKQLNDWNDIGTIFDLYKSRNYEYIPNLIRKRNIPREYFMDNDLEILRAIHYMFLDTISNIYKKDDLFIVIESINKEFRSLDNRIIKDMLAGNEFIDLQGNYDKIINVFLNFIGIYKMVTPALNAKCYNDGSINYEIQGITTCTYDDLKMFYMDTYESLLNMVTIPLCLDNIKYRNAYDVFYNQTLEIVKKMSKGNRISLLKTDEYFTKILDLNIDNKLRNAIGHNDYQFDGYTQVVTYIPNESKPGDKRQKYLLQIAMECIDLMQSAVVIGELIFQLIRKKTLIEGQPSCVNSIFYKNISVNDKCACGSGKKFKKCCKNILYEKGIV